MSYFRGMMSFAASQHGQQGSQSTIWHRSHDANGLKISHAQSYSPAYVLYLRIFAFIVPKSLSRGDFSKYYRQLVLA